MGSRSLGGGDGVGSEETVGEDEDARGAKRARVHEEELVEAETKSHKLTQIVRPKPREDPRSTTVRALGVKRQALAPAGPGLGDAEPSV